MTEFIVWDENEKKFITTDTYKYVIGSSGQLLQRTKTETLLQPDNLKYFLSIGIKDINDKPIYADCSIVEFEYEMNHPLSLRKKEIGHFYYDLNWLCYLIKTENGIFNIGKVIEGTLKIIDTIQENKLGLIKE